MFVLLAFFPLLLWAEGEGSNKVTTYEVSGTYTYSTDPNHSTYNLPTSGSLDLRKMAFTMCITLDNLPDGMHYEWKLLVTFFIHSSRNRITVEFAIWGLMEIPII